MSSIINFQLYWQLTLWLVLLLSTKSIKFVLLSIATTSRVLSILQTSKNLSPHCRISHSKYSSPFEVKEISIKKKWTISRKSMLAMLSSNRKLLWSWPKEMKSYHRKIMRWGWNWARLCDIWSRVRWRYSYWITK